MNRWLLLIFSCWAFGFMAPMDACGQRERGQNPARQRKAQLKMKRDREKQNEALFREGRKSHWKAQDRSTRKRWRAQRRAARRMRRGGGPDSWYQGLFRSGKPIPWTRRTANKVGNLFKRKRNRRQY